MTAGCGLNLTDSFASYDLATHSWKMSQASLPFLEDTSSVRSSVTWPRAAMMRSGIVYPQLPSAPRISDTASSSSLPTPNTMDHLGAARMNTNANVKKWGGINSLGGMAETGQWPTPREQAGTRPLRVREEYHSNLEEAVALWPTPTGRGYSNEGSCKMLAQKTDSREEFAQMSQWPAAAERLWDPTRETPASPQQPSLWPTPDTRGFTNASAIKKLSEKADTREEFCQMAGPRVSQREKEEHWPTQWELQTDHAGTKGSLRVQVEQRTPRQMFPTPTAGDPGFDPEARQPVDKDGNPPTHPNQRFYDPQTGRVMQKGIWQVVQMFPTPIATDATNRTTPEEHYARQAKKKAANPNLHELHKPLIVAVQEREPTLWPTPTVQDSENKASPSQWKRNSDPLNVAVMRPENFPTPTASDHNRSRTTMGRGPDNPTLQGAVSGISPGDARRFSQSASGETRAASSGSAPQESGRRTPPSTTPSLSATWVEWLMGFPREWTVLIDLKD